MSGHGGARKGAGRPKALPPGQRVAIGWMCETLRRESAEQIALERLGRRRKVGEVRDRLNVENARRIAIVEKLRAGDASPLAIESEEAGLKKWQAIALAKFSKEVSPVLDKQGRAISLADYRPRAMSRPEVYKKVSAECAKLGWGKISVHQIRDCWRDHSSGET